jgi:hypothetical protein
MPQVLVYGTAPNVPAGCEPETERPVTLDRCGKRTPPFCARNTLGTPAHKAIRAAQAKQTFLIHWKRIGFSSDFLGAWCM